MDDLMIRQAQLATSSQNLQTIQPPKQRTYISLPGVSQEICINMLEIHEGQNTSITVHIKNDTLSDSGLRLRRVLHHRKNFANLFAPLVCVFVCFCVRMSAQDSVLIIPFIPPPSPTPLLLPTSLPSPTPPPTSTSPSSSYPDTPFSPYHPRSHSTANCWLPLPFLLTGRVSYSYPKFKSLAATR